MTEPQEKEDDNTARDRRGGFLLKMTGVAGGASLLTAFLAFYGDVQTVKANQIHFQTKEAAAIERSETAKSLSDLRLEILRKLDRIENMQGQRR